MASELDADAVDLSVSERLVLTLTGARELERLRTCIWSLTLVKTLGCFTVGRDVSRVSLSAGFGVDPVAIFVLVVDMRR